MSKLPSVSCSELLRDADWEQSPLGPRASWSQSLRTSVDIIMSSSFPMFISWGSERTFIYNDSYAKVLGEKHPRAFGSTFGEIWSEIWADIEPLVLKVESGESVYLEDLKLVMNRFGFDEETYFTFSYSPLRDERGDVRGLFCSVVETTGRVLTERKLRESERELKASEERFRSVMENMSEGIMIYDARGNLFYQNPAAPRIHCLDRHEIFEAPLRDLSTKWFIRDTANHAVPFDQWPISRVLRGEIVKDQIMRIRHEESEREFFVSYNGAPIFDPEGRLTHAFITIRDMTGLKEGERALQESEAKFRTITEAMPQMVWSTNPEGGHEYFNIRWYDFTGTKPGETDGVAWDKVLHPDDRERAWQVWRRCLSTGEPYQIEYRIRHHTGEYRWALGRALPIRDDQGAIVRWMGTCTDIHEQKVSVDHLARAKESAERANELKSAFLANMSHEIRTPLGAMLGFADLLRDEQLTPGERVSYLDILIRNGEQLSVIINDILDLSKVEAGQLNIERTECSPVEIAREVVNLFRVKAEAKGLRLQFHSRAPHLISATSDPLRVRQVLMNLVGNAIKFTHSGSVDIVLSQREDRGRTFGVYQVTDSGIGIANGHRDQIFEMFVQADNSMTRKFGGTGLGLALSRRLAREMGGDVEITNSIPGKGSTFTFSFENYEASATVSSNRSEAKADSAPELGPESLRGVNVLIVDDSPDNRFLFRRYLDAHGAVTEFAENGVEACEKALSGDFDVVVMDIQMPIMDGYSATERLRQSGYRRPIVALTAHAMNDVRARCVAAGCTDHLAKPVRKADLVRVIQRLASGPA